MISNKNTGSILRIEKSSIHDGDGLRTVVFLKGCPLSCLWCSTPESQKIKPQKGYDSKACNSCGICVRICPQNALTLTTDGNIDTNENCIQCFKCVPRCPKRAIKKYGYTMTVDELMKEISKDEIFYFHSNGGVTISGGEPLFQADFVAKVLSECQQRGINTAIETTLHSPRESVKKILSSLNLLYVDLKHMDPIMHKKYVGSDNELIYNNIKYVAQSDYNIDIIIRIPMVKGINDTDENLLAVGEFCRGLNKLIKLEILPYHRLGINTYNNINMEYLLKDLPTTEREYYMERADFLINKAKIAIPVTVG